MTGGFGMSEALWQKLTISSLDRRRAAEGKECFVSVLYRISISFSVVGERESDAKAFLCCDGTPEIKNVPLLMWQMKNDGGRERNSDGDRKEME
jgi:hypothetical protein